MCYVVYHIKSTHRIRSFEQASAAKRSATCSNRNAGSQEYAWASEEDYERNVVTTKRVRNLMSGEEVEIASNTPTCCDPSMERYWSM